MIWYLQGLGDHGLGEGVRIVLAGEVEAVHLPVVAPLVEGGGCLVVLERLLDCTVDHHLQQNQVSL